ncbi:hypothetical protein [Fodinicola acaciae]|uniref:hypothetical protein n=1 Tax=Fodinicola acaciae TaxID=2681555 RepID=UPI0013D0A190|nr:hypothetical protein [Fodinicola acaciae]
MALINTVAGGLIVALALFALTLFAAAFTGQDTSVGGSTVRGSNRRTVRRRQQKAAAIVGGATVVLAVLVIAANVLADGHGGGDNATTSPPTAAAAGQATPPASTPSTTASPTARPAPVLWHGKLRLEGYSGVDTATVPPTVVSPSTVNPPVAFFQYKGKIHAGEDIRASSGIAEWTGSETATAGGCANVLATQPATTLSEAPGLRFCTQGGQNHQLGFASIASYDGTTTQVDLTIWSQTYGSG